MGEHKKSSKKNQMDKFAQLLQMQGLSENII